MIKAIIFDFGGVLTVGRYTASIIKEVERRHNISAGSFYETIDGFVRDLDAGKITPGEFVESVNRKLKLKISLEEMRRIFEWAIKLNPDVIGLIKKLHGRYRLILLSNNNEITISILRTKYKEPLDLFEKTYFSSELKISKPSKEFFEHMLKDASLKAGECLFIDDKEKNIRVAEKLGLKGILFESAEQLKKELASSPILRLKFP